MWDSIELSIFASRMAAVCDEMGAVLQRSAFSPNIKDRLDFSCAVFDPDGCLCAQAAHIPVHLGSMAYAMGGIVERIQWQPGDMVILNDPYLGGTHLPDVTVIAPAFDAGQLMGFVANRAHHADIGAESPGSMPISRQLSEEGLVIAPGKLVRGGAVDEAFVAWLTESAGNEREARGDFAAQISANRTGVRRLVELVRSTGGARFQQGLERLNAYGEQLARAALRRIPDGTYRFQDWMDDDGQGRFDIPIAVALQVTDGEVKVDFTGTAGQVHGNINCPLAVAAAAVFYVLRCLMPPQTPACAGSFRAITLHAPEGSLVNARRPAAVAAGNVETSTRIVDVVLGALRDALPEEIPAASHGSMNNVALGAGGGERSWNYYETIGGGMGAGPRGGGLSAVQTHMTNTLNTPVEALEMYFPLRVRRYGVRHGSGGAGRRPGGDGIVREFELLGPARATVLSERRCHSPWGLAGGGDARPGCNRHNGTTVPGKVTLALSAGDRLTIESAGGGGWGAASSPAPAAAR